jgi:hypothetical protein
MACCDLGEAVKLETSKSQEVGEQPRRP